MPSAAHKRKVDAIIRYVNSSIIRNDTDNWLMMVDHDPNLDSPPKVNGLVPDVLASNAVSCDDEDKTMVIVGEAKTSEDFSTPRSANQILKFLNYQPKKKCKTILILCVTLDQISAARKLVQESKQRCVNSVVIINELSEVLHCD